MSTSKCFAQYHMTCAEYGLWDQCRALSHKSGILFFDGRRMAARFNGCSYSTIYRLLNSLVLKNWITKIENSQPRRTDGTYTASQYWVLSHEQWTAKHGKQACSKGWKNALEEAQAVSSVQQDPVAPVTLDKKQPVSKRGSACFKTPSGPVSPVKHSLVKEQSTRKEETQVDLASAQDFSFSNNNTYPLTAELPLGGPNVPPVAPVQLDVSCTPEVKQPRAMWEVMAELPKEEQWALYRRCGDRYTAAEAEAALAAYRAKSREAQVNL